MSLDIYAGTLTRYYSHNWKNIAQQFAEENGLKYKTISPGRDRIEPEQEKKLVEQISDAVYEWMDHLVKNIDPSFHSPLWDEKNEHDYFTDRPGWEAFGALIMLQACRLLDCPLPEYVESGWNAYEEPIVEKAMSQEFTCSLISSVTHWLPIPKEMAFVAHCLLKKRQPFQRLQC